MIFLISVINNTTVAIATALCEHGEAKVQAIGVVAVNKMVKVMIM
jgi:stage V sporulation protein SpoVS